MLGLSKNKLRRGPGRKTLATKHKKTLLDTTFRVTSVWVSGALTGRRGEGRKERRVKSTNLEIWRNT